VLLGTPRAHGIENALFGLYHILDAIVDRIERAIGNDAGNLDDPVRVGQAW